MVDLYMRPNLTSKTDIWALGCCLYTMLFFKNTFEEGSNLAILSAKYDIPSNHPYGLLPELLKRMLEVDGDARLDIKEVIQSLINLMENKPLPALTRQPKPAMGGAEHGAREGSFNVSGQGVGRTTNHDILANKEAKQLSGAAARRRQKKGAAPAAFGAPTQPPAAPPVNQSNQQQLFGSVGGGDPWGSAPTPPSNAAGGFDDVFGGGGGDGFGSSDFGSSDNNFGTSDYFGSSDFGAPTPAPASAPIDDFFGGDSAPPSSDPFGSNDQGSASDPFGSNDPNPSSDPFGSNNSNSNGQDPFGASSDPFGTAPAPAPPPAVSSDPFGADPFSSAPAPPLEQTSSAGGMFGSQGGISFGNGTPQPSQSFGSDNFSDPSPMASPPPVASDPFGSSTPVQPMRLAPMQPAPTGGMMNNGMYMMQQHPMGMGMQQQPMGGVGAMPPNNVYGGSPQDISTAFGGMGATPKQMQTPPNSNARYQQYQKQQNLFNSVGGKF